MGPAPGEQDGFGGRRIALSRYVKAAYGETRSASHGDPANKPKEIAAPGLVGVSIEVCHCFAEVVLWEESTVPLAAGCHSTPLAEILAESM